MFGFKRKIKRPDTCPVNEDTRLAIEEHILFLLSQFGENETRRRKVLLPNFSDFPIKYDGSDETAFKTLKIVATQMEIPYEQIDLKLYTPKPRELKTGGGMGGNRIFLETAPDAAGVYTGLNDYGQYEVWLSREKLREPENMVAVLSHELSHVKLLGEERMEENDEQLTDITTIFFGFGIFNANAAFQTYRGTDSHGWQSLGYLSQMEWGYALALFAYIRGEENPKWIDHVTLNVKGDFVQGQNFIRANKDLIFTYSRQ